MESYLCSTAFFDFDNPAVQAFADEVLPLTQCEDVETAVSLYYAVRDRIAYNPYVFSFNPHTFSASYCLEAAESYCVPKAVLLGALARYKGIPSRLGLADVKNHISSRKFVEFLRSDVFVMHGYIELYLNNRWVKATPAFDTALCHKMSVTPLDFDGKDDSIFQEFNHAGHKEMEYLNDYGIFTDVPVDFIIQSVKTAYPHFFVEEKETEFQNQSLETDLDTENELNMDKL